MPFDIEMGPEVFREYVGPFQNFLTNINMLNIWIEPGQREQVNITYKHLGSHNLFGFSCHLRNVEFLRPASGVHSFSGIYCKIYTDGSFSGFRFDLSPQRMDQLQEAFNNHIREQFDHSEYYSVPGPRGEMDELLKLKIAPTIFPIPKTQLQFPLKQWPGIPQ
jgi:hypothetical protein